MLYGSRTAIQLHACHATGNDLQDLDKKDALAEKKRETIMTDFNKTLSELGGLQDALAKSQLELERMHFELQAKQGACWQGGAQNGQPMIMLAQAMHGLSAVSSTHGCVLLQNSGDTALSAASQAR